MKARSEVRRYLHDHIVGAMHLGQLHAGDRLPGVRKTARELGVEVWGEGELLAFLQRH